MIELDWDYDEKGCGTCNQYGEIKLNDGTSVEFEIEGSCTGWYDLGDGETEPNSGIENVELEINITGVYNAEGWEVTYYNEEKLLKKIRNEIRI